MCKSTDLPQQMKRWYSSPASLFCSLAHLAKVVGGEKRSSRFSVQFKSKSQAAAAAKNMSKFESSVLGATCSLFQALKFSQGPTRINFDRSAIIQLSSLPSTSLLSSLKTIGFAFRNYIKFNFKRLVIDPGIDQSFSWDLIHSLRCSLVL